VLALDFWNVAHDVS